MRQFKFVRIQLWVCVLLYCLTMGSIGQSQEASPTIIRVMSYNIHHARGLDDRVDPQRIAKVIMDASADIVALQEVDRGVKRTNRLDLPKEISQAAGMLHAFAKNIPFQGGEYGNAILSKFPMHTVKNLHYQMLRDGEQRGLLQAVISVKGNNIVFMSTHLDYRKLNNERMSNVTEIQSEIESYGDAPVILCGDFNDFPESAVHIALKRFLIDTWEVCGTGNGYTYSSKTPKSRIDYCFISKNSTLKPVKATVIQSNASDHNPLVVELELPW
jgi:endonuclease/exonuclease/phosphatase family metal-dependent hydrolase